MLLAERNNSGARHLAEQNSYDARLLVEHLSFGATPSNKNESEPEHP